MNEKELNKLYTALINKGYSTNDLGDEDTFHTKMKDKANRKELYDWVSSKGNFRLGDYASYENRLSSSVGAEEEQPQSAISSNYELPNNKVLIDNPNLPKEPEYIEGFAPAFKQSSKNLWQGIKAFAGEVANIFTGSSRDEKEALNLITELESKGIDINKASSVVDIDNSKGNEILRSQLLNKPDKQIEFKQDLIRNGSTEEEADAILYNIVGEGYENRKSLLRIKEAIKEAGGDVDKAKLLLEEESKDTWGDRMINEASSELAKAKPTKGFGAWVGELAPQMVGNASAIALSIFTRNPKFANLIGVANMGGLTVSTMGSSMVEARNNGASNLQTWAVGIADGSIEFITEKIPYDRYTKKLFNGTKKKVSKDIAEAVSNNDAAKNELAKLLVKANKKLGGKLLNGKNVKDYLIDIAAEGASEFTAEALQTITPMIYLEPEEYPTLSEIIENGWEGAKAGLFMGSVLGGASKIAEHRAEKKRRKEQGYVSVAEVSFNDNESDIVEIIGKSSNNKINVLNNGTIKEVDVSQIKQAHRFSFDEFYTAEIDMELEESYNTGYDLHSSQEMNDAKMMLEHQRQRMISVVGANDEALDGDFVDWLNEAKIAQNQNNYERANTILDYLNAKQVYDGMIQRVRDDIDSRIDESNNMIDRRTNKATGAVQGATLKRNNRAVYIVNGNVVPNGNGGIDLGKSEKSIIVCDAETGALEQISSDEISQLGESKDPISEKEASAEIIREQFASEAANKIDGIVSFNPGDTYSIEGDNGVAEVEVVANEQGIVDNGDGTVNVTDGTNVFPLPKEVIQQQVDKANAERLNQFEKARTEENNLEEANVTPTAMERIPKDREGNPIYEQTDSDTAWDALVEQTEGDEDMAQTVAQGMVAKKEAALKKLEKAKAKDGETPAEMIAAEKERKRAIETAKQEVDIWKKIAGTAYRRKVEIEAEQAKIAQRETKRIKAEEELMRVEREETERIEREALNGVPDMVEDTPQDARARGYRRVNGHKIDRQEPIGGLRGKEVEVKFSDNTLPKGRVAVIEADELQPSHVQGMRNPLHFIDEAQPKERNDEASILSAQKIAGNIRPEEITSSVTAYTGAPTVNTRGEAIQGNNRSDALKLMWSRYSGQGAKYKKYLMDHAEEFGLNAEDIAGMQHPVLVNMLDVEDDDAITLGQFVAQDTESGGVERIKPKNALQRMGADMRTFANMLLKSTDEETSFAGLVDSNGVEVLKWMSRNGYISPTQYRSAFDSKGNLTAEAKNDLRGIMYQSIFKGGSTRLEEMFNAMPAKAQKAILATAFRDFDSPNAERMIEEIQNSIRAFYALSQSEVFMSAKTFKDARLAVEGWKNQYQFDDVTGESYLPAENFSNFALLLATMYKGENQSVIQGTFNKLYDIIQGTQEPNLFEQPDNTPRSLAQAIKEVLNLDYNGQLRSNVLVGDNSTSQRGQQGSTGDVATGERIENGNGTTDSRGRVEADSREGEVGSLFQYFTGTLSELVSQAKQSTQGLIKKVIAHVSTRLKEDLSAKGLVIDDEYKHVIDNNAVRHTLKKHSGKNEEKRGQIPIVEADFDKIADVVENYDDVEVLPGNTTAQRIIYQKTYADGTVMFVEEQRVGRKELAAVTMWKKKSPTLTDANRTETTLISDLNGVSDSKGTTISQTTNELEDKNVAPYSITPAQYTTKKGKVLDMHLVKFAGTLTKEQQRAAKELAKADKGWYDREQGGFMMRSEESAKSLAETILGNEEAVSDAQPVSIADIAKINTTNNDLLSDEGAADDKVIVSNAIGKTFTRMSENADGTPYEESLTFTGIENGFVTLDANLLYFKGPHKMSIAETAEALRNGRWQEKVLAESKNEGQFGLVSDERMAELKERLRKKLGGQLNVGIDPEILAIGLEIAVGHIDRGVKSFADFAKVMIADLGDVVRPYLKAFYNGARDLPEVAENGLANEMTPYEEVQQFNVASFDKENSNALATAEIVVAEQAHNKEAEQAKQDIINQRNSERKKDDEQTRANTQTIASQTEIVASETESSIEEATTEEQINEAEEKVDKQLTAIDEQLDKLNYIDNLHSGMRVVTKDGKDVLLSIVMHHGEQLSATQFSKPRVHRLYGTHDGQMIDIAPADIDIDATIRLNEGSNNVASQETPAKEAESYNGLKRGDKVMYTPQSGTREAIEATIHDFEEYGEHKPVLDTGLAPVLYEIAEWSDIKPIDTKEKQVESKKSEKKTVTLQKLNDAGLFDGLFENENNNEDGLQRDDAVRSEGVSANGNRQQKGLRGGSETSSESERQESGESDLGGERTGDAQDRIVRPRLSGAVTEKKNTNNNRSERGKDHSPTSVDARIEANIKAIELAKQLLESGEKATEKQMQTLRKFSGWGGLGKAFNEGTYYAPNPISKQLRELLGEEAYQQAVMSANSAYYTPAYVIDTLWDIAEKMGFEGGNILEGSAGIGNILGQMPTHISERSDIHAIEIDGTSGGILSLLYPDAKVEIQGFEETRIANGSVDLAITNVPFVTGLRVNDTSGDKDLSKKFHNIHDFCIAKNVRKLREGGLGIFITSNGTLDNSKKLRDWIVSEGGADFVGAFRLNNKTFGGTGVTSDIIVIRKRVNSKKSANAIDVSSVTGERVAEFETGETRKVKGVETPIVKSLSMDYNSYFVEHPEKMAGEMFFGFEKGDTFRPTSKGLYPTKGKNQEEMLQEFVASFSAEEFGERASSDTEVIDVMPGKKVGEVFVKDGKLYINAIGAAQPLDVNANKVKGHTKVECFEAYLAIKDALNDVLEYQTKNEGDKGLKPLLDKLNEAYDNFVATYGHFNKNTAIAFLRNDVDFANVSSVETYEEIGDGKGGTKQTFGKADVFSKRVIEKESEPMPTNVKDGIVASIFKFGRVNVRYIAEQLGKDEAEVKNEIIESGYGFEDPTSKQIEVSFQYLSGNVREKLNQAKENNENGEYDKNIKALQEVIPMNIPAHLIDFTLGSSWIDPKLYEDYVKDRTDVSVKFTSVGGTWFMKEPFNTGYEKNRAMGVTSEMLGRTIMGHTLIEAAIQNKSITVSTTRKNWDGSTETITDKEATQACSAKIDEIRTDFKDWARAKMQSDAEMSERMERVYNDTFNNYVPLTIPEEFVPEYFGGASHEFKMRPHQGKAIVRGTMQPLLLAHEVGTGKTFTLISTAMEMRRLGTARKPMIVVQNATVGQFVASAKELYPNAKILTLEEADRTAEGRKNFYAKIKYNDWDMIVVPQSTFEFIPDSEERQMTFVQDKIEEKMLILEQMKEADPNGKSMITRQAEREIELLEEQLAGLTEETSKKRTAKDEKRRAVALQNAEVKAMEMLDRRTDDVENFDDMGIDALLIDEAHEYKHLGFATAMQRGVKGVDPSYSKKSQGVFLKTQAVLEKNNGRNVIFATGTPISNTAAEIWTFMRYLMPADTMKEYGIYYFDDFVRNFGNIQQMLEFTTSGKFKENNRFAGYVNLPELVRIWSGVSDTVLTKEAGGVSEKIPDIEGGKAQDLYLPQTRALRSIMKYVKAELERYDKMSGKQKKENSHIPLTMYGIAKAAAVDARLVQTDAEDDTQSKTNEAVRQTLRALKESEDYKGTVAIFADNYQNKANGFNLYEDIRSKLIAEGVPADEIVVIKSGMTVKKKLEIFEKVNRGEIRVILGSTFTLGTGVNIQERLFTLIHLDAPNRPMDYTQRNGRILRQGNLHKDMGKPVRVLRFGVEDSLDVTAYQRLKTKGAIADSIMNGKQMMANSMTNRVLEEEEDVFGDTVAQLSGSEYAMLKNNAEKNVRKYASRKKQWEADQTYIHNAKPRVKAFIKDAEKRIEDNSQYLEAVRSAFPEGKANEIVIGKNRFKSVEAMEEFLKAHNKSALEVMKQMKDGEIAGEQKRELTIEIGDFKFIVTTKLTRQTVREGANLFNDVERKMTYSCEELGIEEAPVRQNLLRNAVEDITQNVITGKDFAERLEVAERLKRHNEAELEQLLQREGKPFEYEEELKQAQAQYEEYSEAMKKELAEKEAKYAEMDANIETADNIANAEEADELEREGNAIYFNDEEAYERMAERVEELAKKLHLDNVEIVTDVRDLTSSNQLPLNQSSKLVGVRSIAELEGKKRRAKGFYSKSTGKITIVIPNHRDMHDVEQSLIHEAVAHYGLRQLFGEEFDTFIDNIYAKANKEIREKIVKLASKKGWDFRKATEEYLASLAEETEFKNCPKNWWNSIKEWFKKLLYKFGFSRDLNLNDNSLRYILWRSYENLKKPADKRNAMDVANDIALQYELKVGNFAENFIDEDVAKEYIKLFSGAKDLDIRILNSPDDVYNFAIEMGLSEEDAKESAEESKKNYVGGGFYPNSNIILIFAFKGVTTPLSDMFHEHVHYAIEQLGGVVNVMTLSNELKELDNELVEKIKSNYKDEDIDEEIITYSLQAALSGNAIEDLNEVLSDEAKSQLEAILEIVGYNKNINYGRKNEKFSRYKSGGELEKVRTRTRRRIAEYSIKQGDGRNRTVRKKWDSNFGVEGLLETSPKKERQEIAEIENDVLFREGTLREEYDRKVRIPNKSGSVKWNENIPYRMKEAYQDSMAALKTLQDLISEETGNPIKSYEDAYMAENRMSSENKAQAEIYERDFYNPLRKAVQVLIKAGSSYENLKSYIIAKHGLERNRVMAERDAKLAFEKYKELHPNTKKTVDDFIKEFRERDYSGLTALTGKDNVADAEAKAQRMVNDYEQTYDTANLWRRINAATKETLRKSYDSGLMDKATYENVRDMYEHYVPLRGWDCDVASNEYKYLSSNKLMLSPALKVAKGRTSLADDPLATIGFMAESSIVQGNRNRMKQKFLNFILNNPTDLVSVSEQWYVLDNATGEWEARNPIIPDNATGDQVAAIVNQFEQKMEALGDKATKKIDGLKLSMNITKREGQEHVVRVKRNGKEYCLYINGSPRAAQAINGLTNPDVNGGSLYKATKTVKNWMATMFTSKNPAFIATNLSRDVIWAGTAVAIKEDAAYTAQYTKNISECLLKAQLPRLLVKFKNGTLDMNNELERYFDEFIRNGGETGFTQLNTVENYKRNIERFVKEAQGEGSITKKAWNGLWDNVEFLNRSAEDTTRFMVYMTSRQMDRDMARSIYDAKEITVNFNKKGSGGLGAKYMNFCYVFFNATIQSLANFGKLMAKHPAKTTMALTLYSSAGFIVPMLNLAIQAMFGGDDDDENGYWDLPEWVRRNNIVLYVPWSDNGYITIPLPHEMRPFYGMGEIAFACLMNKENVEDGLKKAAAGFSALLPIDLTGNGGNIAVNMTPTIVQPIAQIVANTDYFGKPIYKRHEWNERDPEWTKAYKGTAPWLVDATRWLNEATGGDNVKSGLIDLNPALIEHIFESYLGGVGKTINKSQKTLEMLWNEDLREWRNVPVVSSFYQTAEERTAGSQINREYNNAVDEMEDTQHLFRGYNREVKMGNIEYAEKINELINSEVFKHYQLVYNYDKAIDEARQALKLIKDPTQRDAVETTIMNLKVEMLNKLEERKRLSTGNKPTN